jgi:hypothetical protein
LVFHQPGIGNGYGDGWPIEKGMELAPEHESTAADTDDEDVDAGADSGPQVDLEQSPAQPNTLRLPYPSLQHAFVHSLCSIRLDLVADPQYPRGFTGSQCTRGVE